MKYSKIFFLTEASDIVGYGHFYECLAIAKVLRKKHFEPFFFIKGNTKANEILKNEKFQQKEYYNSYDLMDKLIFHDNGIIIINLRWAVLEIMELVKRNGLISIIIDELGEKKIVGDYLINGSLIDEWHKYEYPEKKPVTLFGPKYLIISENFSRFNGSQKYKRDQILISMGGVDRSRTTLKIIEALKDFQKLKKCVIIGPGFKEHIEIETLKKIYCNFEYIEGCNDLSELIFSSDIVFSAGGDTLHESACVGTPAIVLWEDEHERIQAESFVREGCAINLGKGTVVSYNSIQEPVQSILDDNNLYQKMSEKGKNLVDGNGIFRLVQIIETL